MMSMHQILETIRAFDGILELAPEPGSEFPELAWGDHFFYYAPDGQTPHAYQPFATVVTKDYPGEPSSGLAPPDRYRVNVHAGRTRFTELIGETPRAFHSREHGTYDFTAADVLLPHPAYGSGGWIAVVNPAQATMTTLEALLSAAYARQRRQVHRDCLMDGGSGPTRRAWLGGRTDRERQAGAHVGSD